MPRFLVEAYVPRPAADAVRERARTAARELAREGTSVRHVRTTFVPEDETCFHVFEAASAEAVEEVVRRAELGSPRIVSAIE